MKITHVKVNGMNHPMGCIMDNYVTISWNVEEATSAKQKESRVVIARDEQLQDVVCMQEGKLSCSGVTMKPQLQPRSTYYVQVTVTGEGGDTACSAVCSFDTGKMQEDWAAQWIGVPEGCDYHPILFTDFESRSEVIRGRLYISGVGLYEASINGEKVGCDVLAPFFNDYHAAIQAQTYDVTDLLQADNTIEIMLGNGWYKGRLGYDGDAAIYGKQFAAIAELHLEYADGSEQIVLTDESWKVKPSDITASDIYDGETIDRTIYRDERPVSEAVLVQHPDKAPIDRYSMPLQVMEQLPVAEVIRTPAGEWVLDFGQNFTGVVSFRAHDLHDGETIVLEHGEILQNGNFYHDNYRSAQTKITYISDGRQEWVCPKFTFMGFRYVKVTGWPGTPEAEDFIGNVIYSAMDATGTMETGHEKVNRLLSNVLWGLKSNFVDMPTDCPQRNERLGWTGDAQVFAPTASFLMDTKAFYRKFLWDMRTDQVRHDGAVANFLPNIHNEPGGAAVWADAAAFIPETVYQAYADEGLLRETYPLMRDWVDFVTREDEKRPGGAKHLFDFRFTFGDWLAMDGVTEQSMKGGTEDAYIASIYYYASVCKVLTAARILGNAADEKKYASLKDRIFDALIQEYFTPAGRLAVDTQAAYIIALRFGVWKDEQALIRGLRDRMRRDGYRIKCGFVGAPLICETLADHGLFDLAMHIFLQEKFPSWLHCVNLGATTIWERWNSVLDDGSISGTGMNSLNHYAYGSVANFAVRNIAGLTPTEPGYRRVRIAPQIDARLGSMNLHYRSASGTYVVRWDIAQDGALNLHVEIPFDCEAELVMPGSSESRILVAGSYDFTDRSGDYGMLYTMDTMLDDMAGDERAMQVLQTELPGAYGMALSGNPESLSMTLNDLKYQPWFGFRAEDVERAAEALQTLRKEK